MEFQVKEADYWLLIMLAVVW